MVQQTLAERLADLPLGAWRYFDRVGSTNDLAARWAEAGAPDLSLVVADEQTAGRGRSGRRWYTPAGAALAFSLVLRPQEWMAATRPTMVKEHDQTRAETSLPHSAITRLTALGALAICDALRQRALSPTIKWPNDVLLRGRKVAGVLVEMQWQGDMPQAAILGIGINVASSSVPSEDLLDFPATCIEAVLQQTLDRWELLHDVLVALMRWRSQVTTAKFLQAWEEHLSYRGEEVCILSTTPCAQREVIVEGTLIGLYEDGSLKIRTSDGALHAIPFGELRLRSQPEMTEQASPC